MRLLNVKETTCTELKEKGKTPIPRAWYNYLIYIRCNSKGEVNWKVAPVYKLHELEERGDYKVHELANYLQRFVYDMLRN